MISVPIHEFYLSLGIMLKIRQDRFYKHKNLLKVYLYGGLLGFLLCGGYDVKAQSAQDRDYRTNTVQDLHAFFRHTDDRIPLVCGHRGGASVGYTENAIETFTYTLSQGNLFFEVDPRLTKDSVIVLLHDATLDRTTTGHGRLSDYTYEEIKTLFLKDAEGNVTTYKIPLLEDAIKWAKGKTFLMLDRKDVPLPMLYDVITRNNAESYVIVSAYTLEEAKFYHERDKDIMIEAFITNHKKFVEYEESGISWKNIIAYMGQPKSKTLYDKIHEKGSMIIVHMGKVFDKLPDKDKRKEAYREIIDSGVDILLSDRPVESAQLVKEIWLEKNNKQNL